MLVAFDESIILAQRCAEEQSDTALCSLHLRFLEMRRIFTA